MPWKFGENGELVVDNGAPVWVTDAGEERTVPDYGATLKHISDLNKESADRKNKLREQAAILKQLEGIDDIPAFLDTARKNAEAVASFDDAKRTAEQNIQARINAAIAPKDKRIAELEASESGYKDKWHHALIDGLFAQSEFVKKELLHPEIAKRLFAPYFSFDEDGQLVAHDDAGNPVVEYGDSGGISFDSTLRKIVSTSPFKDSIMVGSRASGSGSSSSGNKGHFGPKIISRAEFEKLDPASKMARMKDGYKIAD